MMDQKRIQYAFGPFRLAAADGRLFRNTDEINLRPKTLDVLALLVEHAGTLLSHAAILQAVWKDVHVGTDVVIKSISEIRQALDDKSKSPVYVETLYRRGFRFIAPVRLTADAPQTAEANSVFVGRVAEFDRIMAVADEALAGNRRAIILTGLPGIGKTRLLHETTQAMARQGAWVLYARADNAARHSGFWIWTQLLHEFARRVSPAELARYLGAAAADIALVVPSLQERLHDAGTAPPLEPELARARFVDGIVRFLCNVAQQRPLVLALDDLDKESGSSLALLQSAIADPRLRRFLVVATARQRERTRSVAFAELADAWLHNGVATEVALLGLSEEETSELIDLSSLRPLSRQLRQRIAHDAHGNPYFTVEILRWLNENEALAANGAITAYRIPETVQRVVRERLDHCTEGTRALLRVAAVIGVSFNARSAAQVAGLATDRLFATITEALEAHLVVEVPGATDELTFVHDLIRETLLQSLPSIERADLHFRIGESIEAMGQHENLLPQLAYHFSHAGVEKAVRYCLLAGKRASEHYANSEATQMLRRALEIADRIHPTADEQTFQILESLAEVFANTDKYEEADQVADRMHTLAVAHANPSWLARAAIAMSARCYMPERMQRGALCVGALEEALVSLPEDGSYLRGVLSARAALALLARGDSNDRRIELAAVTTTTARQQTDLTDRGYLLRDAIMGYWDADHLRERMALVEELGACAKVTRNLYLGGEAIAWRALGLLASGLFNECDAYTVEVEPTIIQIRTPAALLYQRRVQLLLHVLRGRLAQAQRCFDDYAALKAQSAAHLNAAEPLETMLMLLSLDRERGIAPDTLVAAGSMAGMFPHMPLRQSLPYLFAQVGMVDDARAQFEAVAASDFADLPARNEAHCWLAGVAALGDACAELGDQSRAGRLYELLRPYEHQWGLVYYAACMFGSVDRVLGRLAALLGRPQEADVYFQRTLATCEREQAITELIRTQLDYAKVLVARSSATVWQATQLRQQSLRLASEHDLQALKTRAQQALAERPSANARRRRAQSAA